MYGFKRARHTCRLLLLGCLTWCITSTSWAADLAVVIDDVGYHKIRGLRAIQLSDQITLAVLPFAPHTQYLVRQANALGRDMIVHQPMEPHPSPHARLEHDTLKLSMSGREFDHAVVRALNAIPESLGVSNHTGSLLTQHRQPMKQLMQHLSKRNLFFLDSRTTAATVAQLTADEMGVVALNRDVFLDNTRTLQAIEQSFNKAVDIARKNGSAILIGHPYPITLDYLEKKLSSLPGDVRLVSLGDLAVKRRAVLAQRRLPSSPHISLGR